MSPYRLKFGHVSLAHLGHKTPIPEPWGWEGRWHQQGPEKKRRNTYYAKTVSRTEISAQKCAKKRTKCIEVSEGKKSFIWAGVNAIRNGRRTPRNHGSRSRIAAQSAGLIPGTQAKVLADKRAILETLPCISGDVSASGASRLRESASVAHRASASSTQANLGRVYFFHGSTRARHITALTCIGHPLD